MLSLTAARHGLGRGSSQAPFSVFLILGLFWLSCTSIKRLTASEVLLFSFVSLPRCTEAAAGRTETAAGRLDRHVVMWS